MLSVKTNSTSNFPADSKFVIQGTIARNEWVDTKYSFDILGDAVKYASEWLKDKSRWMTSGEQELRIVQSK